MNKLHLLKIALLIVILAEEIKRARKSTINGIDFGNDLILLNGSKTKLTDYLNEHF